MLYFGKEEKDEEEAYVFIKTKGNAHYTTTYNYSHKQYCML